jgi:hypothetical protein
MQMLRDHTQELKDRQTLRTTARILHCLEHEDDLPASAAQYVLTRTKWTDKDQIHRALMASVPGQTQAGDSSLVGARFNDLLAYIRPRMVIGQLKGLRRAGFDDALTAQSGFTSASWTGEGKPTPFSKPAFSRLATPLGRLKVSVMVAEDLELVRSATPDSEMAISTELAGACIARLDADFCDPGSAAIAGVRPASIANGAPAFASTGSTALLIDADLGRLIESLLARGSTLEFAHWVVHPITAAFLARLRNANGDYAYPDVTVLGGMLMGLPVVVSGSMPHVGSPSTTSIILLDAARIWIAQDDAMELSTSKAASVQFLDNPTNDIVSPTATTMVSAFQTNTVILRGTITANWKISDPGFCAVLNNVVD